MGKTTPSQHAAAIRNYLRLAFQLAEQPEIVRGVGIENLDLTIRDALYALDELRKATAAQEGI